MYDTTYDPEATIQDADILMAEYAREADAMSRAMARGVCTHSSTVGVSASGKIFYPEQVGLVRGQLRCTEGTGGCTRVFADDAEHFRAIDEALWGR